MIDVARVDRPLCRLSFNLTLHSRCHSRRLLAPGVEEETVKGDNMCLKSQENRSAGSVRALEKICLNLHRRSLYPGF